MNTRFGTLKSDRLFAAWDRRSSALAWAPWRRTTKATGLWTVHINGTVYCHKGKIPLTINAIARRSYGLAFRQLGFAKHTVESHSFHMDVL
jgi:hypothetical protein